MQLSLLILAAVAGAGAAQDFAIPGTWRKFGTTRSLQERQDLAKAAIDQMAPQFDAGPQQYKDIGYWPSASTVLSSMANFDRDTKTETYKTFVTDTLNNAFKLYKDYDQFQFNDDALWWATAAFYASRSYGDQNLLQHAIDTWNHVATFQITTDTTITGEIEPKKFKIQGTCDGVSMVGGVLWRPEADDSSVNAITTGLFMTLGGYLAQSQKDAKFKDASLSAMNWIKTALKDDKGIIRDTIHADNCERSPPNFIFTYNSGKYVEGLVALHAVTKDQSLMDEAINVAIAGMKNAPWQGENGVITEGVSRDKNDDGVFFKSIWVRALNELFKANGDQSPIAILTHSYIDVQYNGLLDLAATGSTYSSAWNGPPQGFTTWGQAAALDLLVAAISANT